MLRLAYYRIHLLAHSVAGTDGRSSQSSHLEALPRSVRVFFLFLFLLLLLLSPWRRKGFLPLGALIIVVGWAEERLSVCL